MTTEQESIVALADLVEDLEAALMYPEDYPAEMIRALGADLGLANVRLAKHVETLAAAELAARKRRKPVKVPVRDTD